MNPTETIKYEEIRTKVREILAKENKHNFNLYVEGGTQKVSSAIIEFLEFLSKNLSFKVNKDSILRVYDLINDSRETYDNINGLLALYYHMAMTSDESRPTLNLHNYIEKLFKNPNLILAKSDLELENLHMALGGYLNQELLHKHKDKVQILQNFLDNSLNKLQDTSTADISDEGYQYLLHAEKLANKVRPKNKEEMTENNKKALILFLQFIDKDCEIKTIADLDKAEKEWNKEIKVTKTEANTENHQEVKEQEKSKVEVNPENHEEIKEQEKPKGVETTLQKDPKQIILETTTSELVTEIKSKIKQIFHLDKSAVFSPHKGTDVKKIESYIILIKNLEENFNLLKVSTNIEQDVQDLKDYISKSLQFIETTITNFNKDKDKSIFSSHSWLGKILKVLKSIVNFFKACFHYLTFKKVNKANSTLETPDKRIDDLNKKFKEIESLTLDLDETSKQKSSSIYPKV